MNALRLAALAIAAFASLPAAAQTTDEPLYGVWEGMLGDSPILACFNGNGVFYRMDDMRLTMLIEEDGGWRQMGPGAADRDESLLPMWEMSDAIGDTLLGSWREGDAVQRIRLERREIVLADEYASPCSSEAFMAPRLRGGTVAQNAAVFDGTSIVQYTYLAPEHLREEAVGGYDAVQISTFAIPPERYYDNTINAALRAILPAGNMGDAHAECLAMVADRAINGDYGRHLEPELLTYRWLVALESNGVYCGGAHGSYWSERRVFDRNSGEEVDPASWLNEAALASELVESGADSYVYRTATEPFLNALRPYAGSAIGAECEEMQLSASSWNVGLAREGVAMIPILPHVASACAETIVLPWEEAQPFLSLEGQAVRLSMVAMIEPE